MVMAILNIDMPSKNFHGLTGVVPILLSKDEFLNSKIDCGMNTSKIDNKGIIKAPGIIKAGPIILPIKSTNIIGTKKANNGPVNPFQKYLFINIKTERTIKLYTIVKNWYIYLNKTSSYSS